MCTTLTSMEALVVVLVLSGCAGWPQAQVNRPVPSLVVGASGEDYPITCYVRARNFHGLVPMSCSTAMMTRP